MRRAAIALALALALMACGQSEPPPPLPEAPVQVAAAAWFICDAIDAPVVLVFERDGSTARVAQYGKPDGEIVLRTEYQLGDQEGAAGSVYTTLIQNGVDVGHIRQISPGMLETPGAAFTLPFTSVRIGNRDITCRWMPRTRLMGFTGRRTIVVSEDGDGDLLYHSYDFASAAEAQQIEVSENGRTTTFSLEVRDGTEITNADGANYSFQADAETEINVTVDRTGVGRVSVARHGPEPAQSEDLIAYIVGAGAE
ncbi:hypothetical protein [Candidatus Viadribacter manganicus]|uniref:Lipoprotein n=1 Tax=Candidatus Viadribacter manganicus TaxID=1759059 RepID=A0A1B1AJ34_9PROT|nr:hypothetical protein [Candidatus Viadribacter manganicus]ANP46567.1 hypothetical protein ATE48_11885 [Candidatus Viadribacter manganicus]